MAITNLATSQKWVELATSSPTSGTSVSFTSIPEYKNYRIQWFGLANSSTGNYQIRFNNDSATNYAFNNANGPTSNGTTYITIEPSAVQLTISQANEISKTIEGFTGTQGTVKGFWNNQSTIDRIDVTLSTGTFTAGTIKIFGKN